MQAAAGLKDKPHNKHKQIGKRWYRDRDVTPAETSAERRLQKRNHVEVFDAENNVIAGTSLES